MTPKQLYQQQLLTNVLLPNANQEKVIEILDDIYVALVERQHQRDSATGKVRRKIKPRAPIKGLYLWGNVGVGKTHLMDLFYESLPVKKTRVHFHEFMLFIHGELKKLQGKKNPLKILGQQLADEYLVICFDEFFVSDIADAMLLGGLLDALYAGGLCLVASSNVAPKDLYKGGLQRESFLPAIKLIEQHSEIFHLTAEQDYRLRHIKDAGVYYTPLDEKAQENMERSFQLFSQENNVSTEHIELQGRKVEIIKQSGKTIWFDFLKLCDIPRSQNDYLELAKKYETILVSNVPTIKPRQYNLATSFIHLIDITYDAHIRVILSAETPIEKIYPKGPLKPEFERTTSRLIEMQSTDYWLPN